MSALKRLFAKRDRNEPLDLARPAARLRAYWELYGSDHGFLRTLWTNHHDLGGGMARRNQPSPAHIRRMARKGIKTVVNLRGWSNQGCYSLEREACERHGIVLEDFRVFSRREPRPPEIHAAAELFERIEYPAVMHCKSGADRAGLMAALYQHLHLGRPIPEAMEQLSARFGHIPTGKTGILDAFFRSYLVHAAEHPISFIQWVDTVYDPAELTQTFRTKWWGTLLSEWILDRE